MATCLLVHVTSASRQSQKSYGHVTLAVDQSPAGSEPRDTDCPLFLDGGRD
jgi:hypothetical protein